MALFDDAMFAPQSGIPGWLGDILKMAQANPEMSQGFPQEAVPMPQPRPDIEMPQNAQPAQGGPFQPQMRPQQQFMGPGGSLQSTLYQIAGALNPNLRHLAQDAQTQQRTAMAAQYLASRGLDPAMAQLVATNPTALGSYLTNQLGGGDKTSDIKEYEFAKQQGFKGTFQDWIANKRAGAGEHGLNLFWGEDENGNPVALQPGKSGVAARAQLPPGVTLRGRDPIKMDAGTHFVLVDPLTRQQIGIIPKDLRGAKREEEIGTVEGKAAPGVHAAETTVNNAIVTIDKLRKHPGIDLATGATGIIARKIPGTEAYNFDALNKQAQGNAFMAARESLKGAGQVTDFEGKKGEEAIANLDAAQTKQQYLAALDNLERMMKASVSDLKKKAGIAPTAPAPSSGASIDDLVKKYSR